VSNEYIEDSEETGFSPLPWIGNNNINYNLSAEGSEGLLLESSYIGIAPVFLNARH
jgi:hypothetical protein